MPRINLNRLCNLLDDVARACVDIQEALTEHIKTTTSQQYKEAGEADIVTLSNLIIIANATKNDILEGIVCESMELLLRIAANDFKGKLANIPEKRKLQIQIIDQLEEVHRNILQITHRKHSFFVHILKSIMKNINIIVLRV